MPIQTTCPACERGYTLPDTQRGKRVRCKGCQETFVVGGEAADDGAVTTADDVPVLREVSDDEARRIKAENRLARAAGKLPAAAVSANGAHADEDEEEDRPSRGPAPKKKSSMPLLLIGGGALLLFLLVCGGGGTGLAIWYFSSSDDDSSQQASSESSKPESKVPAANQGQFGNNAANNSAKAKNPFKPQDNQFKAPVGGGPAREDPNAPPTNIDRALAMLRDEDIRRRQIAADWLNNRAPDPTRQKEVGQALEPLLDDGQTRDHGARALGKWATKDNVPALIKMLDAEGGNAWRPAIEALTRLKDERSVSVLAAQLPNFFRKEDAGRALQALGPVAEKEVVKFIHHKDFGARQKASQLLKGYNTKDDVLIAQHVTDLGSTEQETKRLAAEDLAKVKLDPNRKAEVARALDPLLVDVDRRMREAAVNALAIWAIKDNAAGLLKVMDDLGLHDKALLILIQLKDARTLPALAVRLLTPQRDKISRAMIQIGSPAAVEAAVLPYLGNGDRNVRKQVVAMLALVGSKNSINQLKLLGNQDRTMAGDCLVAIKAIQARSMKRPGL